MKLKVLLASLLMLSLIGLFPSLANAACGVGDTRVCDTVRIGCPFIIPTIVPGDSIMVPIYLWNDEVIQGFTFGFTFDSTALEVVAKRYSLTGSIIPVDARSYVYETIKPGSPGQYLFGWTDWTSEEPYNQIPVNTTDKATLLVTLNFKVKSTATPAHIMIDSAFYPPFGRFRIASESGVSIAPHYVHCPDGDIILGYSPIECCGDVDKTWDINIADVVYMVTYIFGHGTPPQDPRGGDVDCDGETTIADVVYFVNYIFMAGSKPCLGCEGPVITMFAAESDTVEPGGVSRLTVSASDPNCRLLSYFYQSSGGSIVHYGNKATWTAPAIEGQYQVIATVANDSHSRE